MPSRLSYTVADIRRDLAELPDDTEIRWNVDSGPALVPRTDPYPSDTEPKLFWIDLEPEDEAALETA